MITLPTQGAPLAGNEPMSREWRRWFSDLVSARVKERMSPTNTIDSAYQASPWDLVVVDPSGGTFIVTLPHGAVDGDEIAVKNVTSDATPITVKAAPGPSGLGTVDGSASVSVSGSLFGARYVYIASSEMWVAV